MSTMSTTNYLVPCWRCKNPTPEKAVYCPRCGARCPNTRMGFTAQETKVLMAREVDMLLLKEVFEDPQNELILDEPAPAPARWTRTRDGLRETIEDHWQKNAEDGKISHSKMTRPKASKKKKDPVLIAAILGMCCMIASFMMAPSQIGIPIMLIGFLTFVVSLTIAIKAE